MSLIVMQKKRTEEILVVMWRDALEAQATKSLRGMSQTSKVNTSL
jgi:hypothetical protein